MHPAPLMHLATLHDFMKECQEAAPGINNASKITSCTADSVILDAVTFEHLNFTFLRISLWALAPSAREQSIGNEMGLSCLQLLCDVGMLQRNILRQEDDLTVSVLAARLMNMGYDVATRTLQPECAKSLNVRRESMVVWGGPGCPAHPDILICF